MAAPQNMNAATMDRVKQIQGQIENITTVSYGTFIPIVFTNAVGNNYFVKILVNRAKDNVMVNECIHVSINSVTGEPDKSLQQQGVLTTLTPF